MTLARRRLRARQTSCLRRLYARNRSPRARITDLANDDGMQHRVQSPVADGLETVAYCSPLEASSGAALV
jgi:hypothetical protein